MHALQLARVLSVTCLSSSLGLAQSQPSMAIPKAVSYQMGSTSRVDLRPGALSPQASGEAKVQAKQGVTNIEVSVVNMAEPTKFGAEFLTYVVWVVSPDGRASNVGEMTLDNSGKGVIIATTNVRHLSLFAQARRWEEIQAH